MDESHSRLVAIGGQRDLHLGAASGDGMVRLVPSEGEHHLAIGHHLHELAHARVPALDQYPVHATDPRIELSFCTHPPHVLGRVGEEGEDGGRPGIHHDLSD